MENFIEVVRRDCAASMLKEREIDQVVSELGKYREVVTTLQET